VVGPANGSAGKQRVRKALESLKRPAPKF
jgi:hypothetical protein